MQRKHFIFKDDLAIQVLIGQNNLWWRKSYRQSKPLPWIPLDTIQQRICLLFSIFMIYWKKQLKTELGTLAWLNLELWWVWFASWAIKIEDNIKKRSKNTFGKKGFFVIFWKHVSKLGLPFKFLFIKKKAEVWWWRNNKRSNFRKLQMFYVLHLYCREGETVVKGFETFWNLLAKVKIRVLMFSQKKVSTCYVNMKNNVWPCLIKQIHTKNFLYKL